LIAAFSASTNRAHPTLRDAEDDGPEPPQPDQAGSIKAAIGSSAPVAAPPPAEKKLTSVVWKEFKRVKWNGQVKAKCMYCFTKIGGETKNGTKHLHDHLKSCTLRKIKLAGNKTMSQASLRFHASERGKVSVENYTFDQDIARKELGAMMVLHEYPLSMVDHAGFRRFVHALQPLFKIGTRNTIRYMVCTVLLFSLDVCC
jgi:hypothetical protein